jgi:hypothetical protein
MSKRAIVAARGLATSLVLSFVLPAQAHHSFAAEFDAQKVVHLEGTVVKFAWVNPHSWLYISVKNAEGVVEEWKIEGGAPSALLRRGWNRNSLPAGTKIVVNAFRSRDGANRASARDIVFPDGRKLDLAGSYNSTDKKESAPPAP